MEMATQHYARLGLVVKGREAVLHPTLLDIAWAAGVYEGEGSCLFNKGSTHVRIGQNDLWLLERLKALFGGVIGTSAPDLRYQSGRNGVQHHYWSATGARSRGFLMTIYSFLSPRRKARIAECLAHPSAIHHNSAKTRCKHGHVLSGDNLRMQKRHGSKLERVCVECSVNRSAKHYRSWHEE